MRQGTIIKAKTTFSFKVNGKGRTITFKEGQEFWTTTTQIFFNQNGGVMVERKNKGSISTGYFFTSQQIDELFEVIG